MYLISTLLITNHDWSAIDEDTAELSPSSADSKGLIISSKVRLQAIAVFKQIGAVLQAFDFSWEWLTYLISMWRSSLGKNNYSWWGAFEWLC